MKRTLPLLLVVLAAVSACDKDEPAAGWEWPWALPDGFPAPPVPARNRPTDGKVALGRHLFFDRRLSGNGTQSCADCHDPAQAFSDGRALPTGSTGDTIPRNAMNLTNAAYWSTYTWMNPAVTTLEDQALVPMFAEHPVELGMTGKDVEILGRLQAEPRYVDLFADAFPRDDDPYTIANVVDAIASFERTLISGGSAYDRYWYGGDESALSESAKLGMDVFFDETAECYHCHAGPMFSTAFVSDDQPLAEPSFINTGLYNVGGTGAYPEPNTGLYAFTEQAVDMGRIRVPTLRNVAVTAPYFHDGTAATLDEVLDIYMAGGRNVTDGPSAGDGRLNPYKHPLVRPFTLTEDERAGLIAFLESLTDEDFLTEPAFTDPW